jgi:methylglutaconyl-CoA hydratase
MARPRLGTPRTGGERQALSVLLAARRSAVNASTEAQLQVFSLVIAAPEPIRVRFRGQKLAAMLNTIYMMKKPTVARVHGAAFAGGMGLLAACDIAIAAPDAEFCLSEVKLGLTASTISPYVVVAMGERQARRYFLSAERFTAAEAFRIGLIHDIVPLAELDASVNALLGHLLTASPAAIAASKELIRAVTRAPIDADMIADTVARIAAARTSADGREGIRSFLEKRKPAWTGEQVAKGARAKKPKASKR